jgi:hypothetical protein
VAFDLEAYSIPLYIGTKRILDLKIVYTINIGKLREKGEVI